MKRSRTIQEWIHWLEAGAGARGVQLAAVLLGVLALSLLVAWKQFQGPTNEATLRQADTGRQLARGEGFTTLVNYPQTHAYMAERSGGFAVGQPLPELYEAPLYSLVVAGALRTLPESWRESLFAKAPVPPDGFGADYLLLALNLVLFWLSAWLTYDLGKRLFEPRVGWVAALGLLLSVSIWQQVVAVNGLPLLMALSLAAFRCWWQIEQSWELRKSLPWGWLAGLGAFCGLLFLTEYSAGALILVVLGYVIWRTSSANRWAACAILAGAFVAVSGPWVARNVMLTGSPVALAVQNIALKDGDPTASPEKTRATLSAKLPQIELNKLGNKMLTSWQEDLQSRLWSGGAMWFMAFFAAGCLYGFRVRATDRLRWMFTLSLLMLLGVQAAVNSGESVRLPSVYLTPLIMIFGTGFFFVLAGSNAVMSGWPRLCAALLLGLQALPLLHDAMEPRRLHFSYPPYYPGLFMGVKEELVRRDAGGRFGVMADVPAGVAWYGGQRVWAQPDKLRDFYAITLEQSIGELVLTPHTLDRPFFSELAAVRDDEYGAGPATLKRFGEWGRIYAGLLNGRIPADFPLRSPQRLTDNLYVLINPALPPLREK